MTKIWHFYHGFMKKCWKWQRVGPFWPHPQLESFVEKRVLMAYSGGATLFDESNFIAGLKGFVSLLHNGHHGTVI